MVEKGKEKRDFRCSGRKRLEDVFRGGPGRCRTGWFCRQENEMTARSGDRGSIRPDRKLKTLLHK